MYLGNQPALAYTSFAKQDFTTSATTSYTLDNPVTNENEIALFINFVRQEPTTAYTASGTSLTLTSATSASDDMYCVFLGKAVQTVNPPAGSVGLSQLSATGTKDSTTFLRGDNTFATAGGTNSSFFLAYNGTGNQAITDNVFTKVQFQIEVYDTDSNFDNSTNYRFTAPSDGKYLFYSSIRAFASGTSRCDGSAVAFYKNGSQHVLHEMTYLSNPVFAPSHSFSAVLDLTTSDYIEVYYKMDDNTGGSPSIDGASLLQTYFGGYKLIT